MTIGEGPRSDRVAPIGDRDAIRTEVLREHRPIGGGAIAVARAGARAACIHQTGRPAS